MTTSAAPASQLEQLLAGGTELVIRNKTYTVENLRNETGLGFFATFRTPRAQYLAMQTRGKVIGRPQAEAWSVMSTSGRGRKIVDFAIDQGKLLVLA